jgi:hypothetical protein
MNMLDRMFGNPERDEKEEEVRKAYNLLFTSPHGQKVLAHMLVRLHFFDEIVSEDERILSNYAKDLLNLIGVWQGINVDYVVQTLLKAPLNRPEPPLGG